MKLTVPMQAYLKAQCERGLASQSEGNYEAAWRAFARAHIVSQIALVPHLKVHCKMLFLAVTQHDISEALGQILRLFLTPIGHLTGRTPRGNPGRATVSAFAQVPLPPDIAKLYDEAGIRTQ